MGRVLNRVNEASDVEWNIKFPNGYGWPGGSNPDGVNHTGSSYPLFLSRRFAKYTPCVRFYQNQMSNATQRFVCFCSFSSPGRFPRNGSPKGGAGISNLWLLRRKYQPPMEPLWLPSRSPQPAACGVGGGCGMGETADASCTRHPALRAVWPGTI